MEKHYSIDAGRGTKMDGCPYSVFEDGHDVQNYIIPPKGYIFTGFKFEKLSNNQIYDGKLVAQYERTSIQERLTSNLWKILIPIFIVAVLAIVVLLALSIFRTPKTGKQETISSRSTQPNTETVLLSTDTVSLPASDSILSIDSLVSDSSDVITNLTQTNNQEEEKQGIEDQQVTPQPSVGDSNLQFKQEFWTLIHQRTIMMDPYDNLYKENKNKVEGEEYDYLKYTILKDFPSFKTWSGKLHKISVSDLESINTVKDLKNKLNEIE